MSWTVVGPLVTAGGENVRSYFSPDPAHFWAPIRHKSWVIPAREVRTVQAAPIPLRFDHGQPPAGQLVYLQRRSADGAVWAVGDFDVDFQPLPDRDYFLSVEATWDEGTGADVEITGAALCERSAMVGLGPVAFIKNGLGPDGQAVWRLPLFKQQLLERAARGRLELRSRSEAPTIVHDDADGLDYRGSSDPYERALAQEAGQWEVRPLGKLEHSIPLRRSVISVR